jgi:hypothetical protein
LRCGAGQRRFNGYAAAGVELEELGELIFGFRSGGKAEAGRGRAFRAEVRVGGNELEEIESDVFRAARSGVVIAGFHKSLSEHVAKGDGSGSAEMVAT